MKKHLSKRLIALLLAVVLCVALIAPVGASETSSKSVSFEKVSNDVVSASLDSSRSVQETAEAVAYEDSDTVRVSIILDKESTLEKGYVTMNIAENQQAMAYRQSLQAAQETMTSKISREVLGGKELDVVWNMTLAANMISANVAYGDIEEIKALSGVKDVVIENRYEADVVSKSAADPNMATSSEMIGSSSVWSAYTGAGSRIAVIDTGTDTDHQSFNAAAFNYAIAEDAEKAGKTVADYNLLTKEEIAAKLPELNIANNAGVTADKLYVNEKLPFGYNYVDESFYITHDDDIEGEHGSHVAGIATANRYISDGNGGFTSALEAVHTQGVAPDAQLITMKVFGKGGGAYDSDYMVAIEDAIVLGADSINLSLGSGNPGTSRNADEVYQTVLDNITKAGAVVTISAGNSGSWVENSANGIGYLYSDDVSLDMVGSPGSFTNSLAVASVDNIGQTGNPLQFGSTNVFFSETSYTNAPISTLDKSGSGTEYDFVLFSNTGKDGEGNNLLTAYASVTAGKVVLVYRGVSSFFEKHMAVADVNGAACIVVNNQAGTINMDLSDSTAMIPCVSITQADGETIKAGATAVYADDGTTVLYYTGKVKVSSKVASQISDSDYYTMSSFSSWGVPGSLQMKPEITAPGGNIYSVFGSSRDDKGNPQGGSDKYENMSGTSMAAPQVAGMTALVAQYIRENDLVDKTGLSARMLAQSLLMSTAEPVVEEDSGYYYSVLKQGAGLANVNAAVSARSYIVMDDDANSGAYDGKVKVELGDDPAKTGKYTFRYTLFNLSDEDTYYTFDTDVFTQDVFDYDGASYMDTYTAVLSDAVVTYKANGVSVTNESGFTQRDAQRALDAANGKVSLTNAEIESYDIDGDGKVSTYDAYLILTLKGTTSTEIPANGSLDVEVTIDVSGCDFSSYPSGAYIEAYSYAKELATEEGVEGTVHSIPVLGFYGNWSDASMFDKGTLADYWYGTEDRDPYLPDSDGYPEMFTNYATVKYAALGSEYYYYGNPLTDDDEYLPERNAFNNTNGDVFSKYYFSVIRNAGDAVLTVTDANTGEVYDSTELGALNSAYYYTNGGAWRSTKYNININWAGKDASGKALPEDTEVNISLTLAPEYYADADGSYDWDALLGENGKLGKGASLTTRTAIDNTAPQLLELTYNKDDATLTAEASDNRYLAVVALYQRNVTKQVDYFVPNQELDEKGGTVEGTLDVSKLSEGAELYVQVTDYAMNQSTYKLVLGKDAGDLEAPTSITLSPSTVSLVRGTSATVTPSFEPWIVDESLTWTTSNADVATVNENGMITGVGAGTATITATSKAAPTVSATCEVTVKTYDITVTGALQDKDGNPLLFTWDMANDKTWTKYASLDNDINSAAYDFVNGDMYQMSTSGLLHKVNPDTGKTLETSASATPYGAPMNDIELAAYTTVTSGTTILVGVHDAYFFYSNPAMDNQFGRGYFDFSDYLKQYCNASEMTAIAWAGRDSKGRDVFYCMTDSGTIWMVFINFATGQAGLSWAETDLDLSWPGYDTSSYCSMIMGDDGNFYLSYFNGDTNQLYVLEYNRTSKSFVSTLLGDVGSTVWPCALLTVAPNDDEATTDSSAAQMRTVNVDAKLTVSAETQQISASDLKKSASSEQKTNGSLNVANANVQLSLRPQSVSGSGETEQHIVTVDVTDTETTTNGKYVVSYDPSKITYESVASSAQLKSFRVDKSNGKIYIAVASEEAIAAGNTLATVTFSYPDKVNTEVVISASERGSNLAVQDAPVTIPVVDQEEHIWSETSRVEPTCSKAGYVIYTCTCGQTRTETLPALGHQPTVDRDGNHVCARCGVSLDIGINNGGSSSSKDDKFPFTDVSKSDSYYDAVKYLYDNGIMNGVGYTSFGPNQTLTRAMVVTILYRLDGKEAVGFKGTFTDVPSGQWYSDAVEWAASHNVVNGVGNGKFDPQGEITREQLAAILQRYASYKALDTSASVSLNADAKVSAWATKNVEWAAALDLLKGGKSVDATAAANRAEVAVAMYGFITNLMK